MHSQHQFLRAVAQSAGQESAVVLQAGQSASTWSMRKQLRFDVCIKFNDTSPLVHMASSCKTASTKCSDILRLGGALRHWGDLDHR
mmetsp:Transcript_105177/g.198126  ORF Transcript_105177/g.198126 Transcript_105177/m.198126 type:complete len:86 (+) Transcript_105177:595-852(+)